MVTLRDEATADPYVVIAALRKELAESSAERDATLAREAALAEVMDLINRSQADAEPVFNKILEKAHSLCGADMGALLTYDGKHVHAVATHGYPEQYRAQVRRPFSLSKYHQALVDGERLVHVSDIRAENFGGDEQVIRTFFEFTKLRTFLMVPLRKENTLLGLITAFRAEVHPFSDKEIALLEGFAAQAIIAIENTRLLTEQREALEQQTAMAEVLQVINSSPGDLAPVFDTMLDNAMHLCSAAFGELVTFDGEHFKHVAVRGVPAAYAEYRLANPRPPGAPGSIPVRLRDGEDCIHVSDLMADEIYRSGNPSRLAMVDLGGARTLCSVALRKHDTLLGYFTIYRQEVRPFSDKQIVLLKNFAAQAVIAMENARLITEQREALEQQTATAEVLQVINASPGNLAPVFDAILEKATRLCEAAFGELWGGDSVRPVALFGVPTAYAEFRSRDHVPGPGSFGALLQAGHRVVHFPDLIETQAYANGDPGRRAMVDLGGARSAAAVPLLKDQVSHGAILIYRQEVRPFTDKHITLLQNLAAQAVIAMENARLINEQREALEQQTATAEVLQVINASPGNLMPVFDAILEKAHSLCGAAIGSLMLYDGTVFRAVATRGYPEQYSALVHEPFPPGVGHQALIRGDRLFHAPDMRAVAPAPGVEARLRLFTGLGLRTGLSVPLRKDGVLLGIISASRLEVRPFSDKEIALLENFAAQAVIAMENARLINEQREALEQQTAIADVLRAINATPGELAPVFDVIGEKAIKLCDATAGALMLPDGDRFRAVALGGVPEAYAEFCRNSPAYGRPNPGSLPARMLAGDDVVHIKDITDVDEYAPANTPSARALAELGGGRTLLGVALRKDDKFFGMITIFRQEVKPFSDRQIALLRSFADQAVIAMENARLLEEVRQRQEELRITFENMGDGVAMFDETPRLVAWNHKFQEIFDVPDALLEEHQTYADYIRYLAERGDYGARVDPDEQIRRLTEHSGEYHAYERTRPDGRVIEIRHNPVPGGGFVLIYADITERKRNEAEIRAARDAAEEASRTIEAAYRELKNAQANLIQAEKMASLGQLTAGIAHEIKNPLNFVNNFSALSTELIDELRDVLAPEPLGETARTEVDDLTALLKGNLEKVVQHGQRADGIVRSMLDHSRGSSVERRMVDLNALIDEALNLAYHGARAQDQSFNITLERDFGEGVGPIEVNPQDISRVFLNLFANGFYAVTRQAREGGDAGFAPTLKVTTSDAGEAVEIRVRDNGTGIPVDIRDKLFQPFFTTKPTGEGTGLGLSITYDIVTQQHGGSITVDSKVGEYSEFMIRLPREP